MQTNSPMARMIGAKGSWCGSRFASLAAGLLLAVALVMPVLAGVSALAAPATNKDRAFVEYKLYDAMNAVVRNGSASKARHGCEDAKALVARFDPDDFMNAELEECFGYVAELHEDVPAACSRWHHAAALYSQALGQRQQEFESMQETKFLRQERLRNQC